MISGMLSATFGYVDIAILAILALSFIIGLIRGFAKSLKGFFMAITIILASVMLLGVSFQPIRDTEIAYKLDTALEQASTSWGVAYNNEIFYADGEYKIYVNGEIKNLSSVDGINGKVANILAKMMKPADGESLASFLTHNITSLIFAVILFILYCIGFGIIFGLIRRATAGLHRNESAALKAVDRVGGGLVAAGLGFVFILIVLAIFSALQNKIPSVIDYIQQSAIGKFFYDMNPVGKMFEDIFVKGV